MSLSKPELKKQLQSLGIKVQGNYVRKSDITKVLANDENLKTDLSKGRPKAWKAQDLYKKLLDVDFESVGISYDDDEGMYLIEVGDEEGFYFLDDTEGEKFEKLWDKKKSK